MKCAYPWQQMIIDLTGEVVPCCYWSGYGNFGTPLGNTNASSLDEIWRGQTYVALRERVASGKLDGHPCGNCLVYRSTDTFPGFSWPAGYVHESGQCYLGKIPDAFSASVEGTVDPVELLEDGNPLPTPNAVHEDIRKIGRGRYSIWKGWVYFSSSDNADPIASGRKYELACGQIRCALGGLVVDSPSGRNLKTAYSEYEASKSQISAEPSMISLISTADCNIDCPACSQNVVRVTKVQHRPETVPSVLAKVPYLTQFIWHGGEPYLIKEFRSFIDRFHAADNPNLAFGFTSNGTMITEDEARKLTKFPRVNASISIDSFNPVTFEQIRAGAKFDRVWSNFKRLLATYDAPSRIYSVGMVVCKSNMTELASNIEFAIENDIGLNLSPVVIYPVTEQLNVFADFDSETRGWGNAIAEAKRIVASAKLQGRPAIARVDPEGMLKEIERLVDTAQHDYSDTVSITCEVLDPHDSLKKMRRAAIIAYVNSEACAYLPLAGGIRSGELRLPRRHLGTDKMVQLDLIHDVMEPGSNLSSVSHPFEKGPLHFGFRISEFQEVKRPRNINWANYGESTPDGHHIIQPSEIYQVYRTLYAHEVKNYRRASVMHQQRPAEMIQQLIRQVRRQGE